MSWLITACCNLGCMDTPCANNCDGVTYAPLETNDGGGSFERLVSGFFGSNAGTATIYVSYYSGTTGQNQCDSVYIAIWDQAYDSYPTGITPAFSETVPLGSGGSPGSSGSTVIDFETFSCEDNGFTVYAKTTGIGGDCHLSGISATCP